MTQKPTKLEAMFETLKKNIRKDIDDIKRNGGIVGRLGCLNSAYTNSIKRINQFHQDLKKAGLRIPECEVCTKVIDINEFEMCEDCRESDNDRKV